MTEHRRIGRYEIFEEIGRGGFAVVYKARDTSLDRIVALKVLYTQVAENQLFVQRFQQEACTAARFDHPHIITIYEVGEEAGQHYIAMNYLAGRGLDQRLAEAGGPLPLEQVTSIVDQVADALDYIHRRGSVHRDVKPSNVMLSDEGHATLLDFGIVHAADGTVSTTFGKKIGTPQYMSPEQAEGKEIDHRSDVYALGVMAYQMCTGRPPFDATSPLVVLRLHVDKAPLPPRELNPDLPAPVEQVLLKALAKRPDQRYQSAGAFARALLQAEAGLQRVQVERERQACLAQLHERLEAAAAEEEWGEVLALGGQIRALDPGYRDVAERMERARRELRRVRRGPLPTWVWCVGGLAILGVLGLAILFVSRWDERFAPEPTEMPTIAPSDTSTAPPTVIAPVPSPTDPPTAMPTEVTPTRTPTEPPSSAPVLTPGATQVRDADGMVMVYVPAGEFEMGSDDEDVDYAVQLCNEYRGNCERGWYEIEQPVHTVEIDAFWVDQTEVTNAQYALCVADGVCDESHLAGDADFNGDGYPVVGVSWHDANTYCEWTGARLPTEAEWEYAARGPESYIYPWRGDFHCSRGNFDDETQVTDYIVPGGEGCDGHEKTAPVGSYPAGASWCGALDMAGNVWEWVADWYDSEFYEHSPTRSPTGPSSGEYRGLRGGSWGNLQINARCASRLWYHPDYWSVNWGFRCAGGSE